jgi:hypothetical protein
MIEVEKISNQFPNSLIWNKYVMNVNMKQIKCNSGNVTNNASVNYDCAFNQVLFIFITLLQKKPLLKFYVR